MSLAQAQPQLVQYHPETKTSYLAREFAAQQNSFKKDRATSNTMCFLFVTWHKSSSCGAMWQFAGGETYSLVREMGEMGEADIQVVTITITR